MSNPVSLDYARQMLTFYLEAEQAVLSGQVVEHEGKRWTRADLSKIQEGREQWERKYNSLQAARHGRRGPTLAVFD